MYAFAWLPNHDAAEFSIDWWNAEYKEPTTKNCELCRYYGSHHEVCNYCYKCSLWTEKEPTTKNDLGVNLISKSDVDRIINCPYFRQADKLIQIMNLPSVTFKDQLPTKNDLEVDCISRKAVLDAIDSKAWEFCDYLISKGRNDEQKPVSHFADNLRECVREELPSVTPQEPRKGYWYRQTNDYVDYYECSECGMATGIYDVKNYCPNCGAKMAESEET